MRAWCRLLSHCLPAQQLGCQERRRWMNYHRAVSSSALTSFRRSDRRWLLLASWHCVSLAPRPSPTLFLCLQMYANELDGSGSVQPLHAHSNFFPCETSAVTVVILRRLRVASLSPLLWLEQLPLGVTGNCGDCLVVCVYYSCCGHINLFAPAFLVGTKRKSS